MKPKMFVIGILTIILLAGCSATPSEEEIISVLLKTNRDSMSWSVTEYRIDRIGKCESISVDAKAVGLENAWIVFFYQYLKHNSNDERSGWRQGISKTTIVLRDGVLEDYIYPGCP